MCIMLLDRCARTRTRTQGGRDDTNTAVKDGIDDGFAGFLYPRVSQMKLDEKNKLVFTCIKLADRQGKGELLPTVTQSTQSTHSA